MSNKEKQITCDQKSIFCTFKYGSSTVVKKSLADRPGEIKTSRTSCPAVIFLLFPGLYKFTGSLGHFLDDNTVDCGETNKVLQT